MAPDSKSSRAIYKVRPQRLSPAGSILLDIVRFGAALTVAVGHFTYGTYAIGWPQLTRYAIDAVSVFFVLSGFVIRLITTVSPVTARGYAVDRISRIYSIALPALLFTFGVAFTLHLSGLMPAPAFKTASFQFVANLFFVSQLWGMDIPASINDVFWSLSYECFYYLIYGVAFFGRGATRICSLIVLALLVGSPILFLLPVWLLGCATHDLYQRLRQIRLSYVTVGFLLFAILGDLAAILWHFAVPGLSHILASSGFWTLYGFAKSHHLRLLNRASFRAYLVGVPTALILLYLLLVTDRIRVRADHRVLRMIRKVADGTFSLYLFHIPLFMLASAYIPYNHSSILQAAGVLLTCVILAVVVEIPLDIPKRKLRKWLSDSSTVSRKPVLVE